jgi:photosystem II stability/assembly factor-like uncharacterized protein
MRARIALLISGAILLVGVGGLAGAFAGVNAPQSGWVSGNPSLGPNQLSDLVCAARTCYASGQFGTLLKSVNGGSSWAGIVTGITFDLVRVRLVGGSAERIVTGGGCVLRRSDDGGETFSRLPFTASDRTCESRVASFSFPSPNVGYLALVDGKVLSTTDGGQTFSRKTAVPGASASLPANDILCPTETTCFAVGASGSIQRTTDGADSWTQVATVGTPLHGLHAATATTLYAVGNNLTVVKSSDGGATWARKPVVGTPPGNLASIRCADDKSCLIATQQGNQILRTSDGAETFASVVPSTDQTLAVAFASTERALAAGALGSAEISNDAGVTWSPVGTRVAGVYSVVSPGPGPVAYAGGRDGVLARTTNAGHTWVNVSAPTATAISGIAAPSANRVFVLGRDGSLQRSDNGGVSYRILNTEAGAVPHAIAALDDSRVLLIGPVGIIRSDDGGDTFRPVQDRVAARARLVGIDLAGDAVFVYGERAILVSQDAGVTWRTSRAPAKRSIRDLDFLEPRVGYLLDTRGSIWKTTNGGRTWSDLPAVGIGGYALEFTTSSSGYVAAGGVVPGLPGALLRTADGGRTWHPQVVSRFPLSTLESNGAADYVLAGEGALYSTTAGGDLGTARSIRLSVKKRVFRKAGRLTVSGRVTPAAGGEQVFVARRSGGGWGRVTATVASNGTFVTQWRVSRTSVFVAQILGDADHAGAGTRELRVVVKPPSRRQR